ncbi:hypothetical protein M3Y94_00088600 [Aphelenchoides besseyi]|nr:hypothetical protein M3Y94_00088600 [Aphelenchoides besseyi]
MKTAVIALIFGVSVAQAFLFPGLGGGGGGGGCCAPPAPACGGGCAPPPPPPAPCGGGCGGGLHRLMELACGGGCGGGPIGGGCGGGAPIGGGCGGGPSYAAPAPSYAAPAPSYGGAPSGGYAVAPSGPIGGGYSGGGGYAQAAPSGPIGGKLKTNYSALKTPKMTRFVVVTNLDHKSPQPVETHMPDESKHQMVDNDGRSFDCRRFFPLLVLVISSSPGSMALH